MTIDKYSVARECTPRLRGEIALVTGAAQGIGRSIAEAFVEAGARVIAADINVEELSRLSASAALESLSLDVTDDAAIAAAAARYSGVSVLVNCAGRVPVGTILTTTGEEMDDSYRVNVRSAFSMIRAFLPAMLERGHGSIINIASVVSTIKAAVERCAYATSKGALIALTRSVALDVIRSGVRCNAISPGTVQTPSLDERLARAEDPGGAREAFVARQPMERVGTPAEIASVAVLLASSEAAYMTGSNVVIDGGFSL